MRHEDSVLEDNPFWYRDAIIYQVHIKAFVDSDADGIGDFRGLIGKLDYLQQLGVTAIWILPFYPSPQRDDGYDIADYYTVNPIYNTLREFKQLLRAAHSRGIRVITELVLNHTSDQHPWFQRARRAKPDSVYRDFYVWSDTPEKYREARIIFQDFETSNWSWDPLAKAYYWHRFYYHQPDLNFDNPKVQSEMLRVIDFWMRLGVDGVRLDAVPYLFEREETNCENLPETHAFLKKLRAHLDSSFKTVFCFRKQTSGRKTPPPISVTETKAPWPSISRSCRASLWPSRWKTAFRSSISSIRRRPSRRGASGPYSCATMMS